jgi:hypothetical protein
MRTVAEIPHELFKITVFSYNSKYILKIELDSYEQVFKISEDSDYNLEDIKAILNENFLDEAFKVFLSMRENFTKALITVKQ